MHQRLAEKETPKYLEFGNVYVEANLPYCLHIPNDNVFDLIIPDIGLKANVCFQKYWTKPAEGSDEADFYEENSPTFLEGFELESPTIPYEPSLGWEPLSHGKNIEKKKDTNGTYRYSKALIEFDFHITEEQIENEKERERSLQSIEDISSMIINRFLDAYRYVSEEEFITRLGHPNIHNIYVKGLNVGYHIISMGHGISNAKINLSKERLTKIHEIVSSGEDLPLHELIFLNAASSLSKHSFAMSVLESYQGLEIFLESFLTATFSGKGMSQEEIEERLSRNWRTKDKLRDVLKEAIGHSLVEESEIWDKWCTSYDKVRNPAIHIGKDVSMDEAQQALEINREVVSWVLSIERS